MRRLTDNFESCRCAHGPRYVRGLDGEHTTLVPDHLLYRQEMILILLLYIEIREILCKIKKIRNEEGLGGTQADLKEF